SGHVAESRFEILTRAGVRTVEILARPADPAGPWSVRVGMGPARCTPQARTVEIAGHRLTATDVDMGNPHAVAFLPAGTALEELDLTRRPGLEPEPARGANIELVSERGPRHVAMRVHERGVGETRSCGTGVAAVAIAAARRAGDDSREPWTVDVPGGRLQVGWDTAGDILLTGPAQLVADGTTLAWPGPGPESSDGGADLDHPEPLRTGDLADRTVGELLAQPPRERIGAEVPADHQRRGALRGQTCHPP